MDTWQREEQRRLRRAYDDVMATPGFEGVNYVDDEDLAARIIAAPEAVRVALNEPLQRLWRYAQSTARNSAQSTLPLTRAAYVIAMGTAAPKRADASVHGGEAEDDPDALPAALSDLWLARPASIRRRMLRWWWEEPAWSDTAQLWPAWRHLVRVGLLSQPVAATYTLGALRSLEFGVPRRWDGGRWIPDGDSAEYLTRRSIADPEIGRLAQLGMLTESQDVWPLVPARVAMVDLGLCERDVTVRDNLERLAQAISRDRATSRRALVDELTRVPDALVAHESAVVRVLASGHPADKAWTLGPLGRLRAADGLREPQVAIDALESAVPELAVVGVKQALAFAKELGPEEHRGVALAALANAKLPAQQAAWKVVSTVDPASAVHEVVEAVAEVREGLLPAVRASADSWLAKVPGIAAAGELGAEAGPGEVRLAREDATVRQATADEFVDITTRLAARSAEPFDLDHLLAIMAANPPRSLHDAIEEVNRRTRGKTDDVAAPVLVPAHFPDAFNAWIGDSLPPALTFVSSKRTLGGRLRPRYYNVSIAPTLAFYGSWISHRANPGCVDFGVTALWCGRSWEAAFSGVTAPATLLATPTHASGAVSAAAFAERLANAPLHALRFDAIAALLRLEPHCEDPAVLAAVRASSHPAAAAALALWGHEAASRVDVWLRPTVVGRSASIGAPQVRSITYPVKGYRMAAARDSGPVLEWDAAPAGLSAHDPMGALAFQRGPGGISERPREAWASAPRGLVAQGDIASVGAPMRAMPWNTDAVAASLASWLVREETPVKAWFAMEEWLVPLLTRPIAPGAGWNALIAAGLLHGHAGLAAAVGDALVADVGLDASRIGTLAGQLLNAASPGAARLATILADAAVESSVGATAAAAILSECVAALAPTHRDLGRLLEAWEIACDRAGLRPDDARAREALVAASGGSSRRAAAAKRLLAL